MDLWKVLSDIMHEHDIIASIRINVIECLNKRPKEYEDLINLLDFSGLKEKVMERFTDKLKDDFALRFRLMVVDGSGELDTVLKMWHEKVAKIALQTIIKAQEDRKK
jgi:hypothetical protein